MQSYQDRVVVEHAENEARLGKLARFIASAVFDALPQAERDRLVKQLGIMGQLSNVLAERIACFDAGVAHSPV